MNCDLWYTRLRVSCTLIAIYICRFSLNDGPIECMDFKPTMLASSVHGVVACYVTAPRVCTLVLFILLVSLWESIHTYSFICVALLYMYASVCVHVCA